MPNFLKTEQNIFSIRDEAQFNQMALAVFRFQYKSNPVYRKYVDHLSVDVQQVRHYGQVPFLPVSFFKTHRITSGSFEPQAVFTSSGTTGKNTSRHYVKTLRLYEESFTKGFEMFFGKPEDYVLLALLPSYLERRGSSLVYMAKGLIERSAAPESGFYLNEYRELSLLLNDLKAKKKQTILLGVTYALLDLAEHYPVEFPELIVMETGGMKGKRNEMVREALHEQLQRAFGVERVYSEYGMTELLSQAYSYGGGLFATPPWMKVLIRDTNDPFTWLPEGRTGGINMIDLSNLYSCSFIETQDLGKRLAGGFFEVLGRFDNSDIRGCNLLMG